MKKNTKHSILIIALILFGCIIRFYKLGVVPAGINQDEAFGGYNAWSLLHYGMDSESYRNPVYLVTWGNGMSALNSYLMIPFIALFGLKTWVIRLPEAIVGCFAIVVFYKLLQRLFDEKIATLGLFLIVINPWQFMISRWALDCNLAPGFLLFGLYFFVRGLEENKYMIVSAIFYGLSLYCYATIWVILPVILLLQILYGISLGKIKFTKINIISVVILGLFALPLLLFIAVNMGLIPEIRTPIMSIPRLTVFRAGELTTDHFLEHVRNIMTILLTQYDGKIWNVTEEYGTFYLFSTPIIVYGLYVQIKEWKEKGKLQNGMIVLCTLIPALIQSLFVSEININRTNCIFLPLLILNVVGLYSLGEHIHKNIRGALVVLYCLSFLSFYSIYFTSYADNMVLDFQDKVDEATDYALEVGGGLEQIDADGRSIYIDERINYAKILFYAKVPTKYFIENRVYTNPNDGFRAIESIGAYKFGYDLNDLDENGIYVFDNVDLQYFKDAGFQVQTTDHYSMAYQ